MQKNNPFKQNTVQYEHSTRKLEDKYLWIKMPVFVKTVFELGGACNDFIQFNPKERLPGQQQPPTFV